MYSLASKSFTSPAKVTGRSLVSKAVIWSIPEIPVSKLSQVSDTLLPRGLMVPNPVTTTRLLDMSQLQF